MIIPAGLLEMPVVIQRLQQIARKQHGDQLPVDLRIVLHGSFLRFANFPLFAAPAGLKCTTPGPQTLTVVLPAAPPTRPALDFDCLPATYSEGRRWPQWKM